MTYSFLKCSEAYIWNLLPTNYGDYFLRQICNKNVTYQIFPCCSSIAYFYTTKKERKKHAKVRTTLTWVMQSKNQSIKMCSWGVKFLLCIHLQLNRSSNLLYLSCALQFFKMGVTFICLTATYKIMLVFVSQPSIIDQRWKYPLFFWNFSIFVWVLNKVFIWS